MKLHYRAGLQKLKTKLTYGFSSLVLLFSTVSGSLPLLFAQTASAASNYEVTASDSKGWQFVTTGDATGSYTAQPSTQISGDGSYELKSTSGKKGYLYDSSYSGRDLTSLHNLGYSYYISSHQTGSKVAPSLSLITTINGTWTELKVEPTYTTDNPSLDTWHTIDATASTTKWYSTHDLKDVHNNIIVHKFNGVGDLTDWDTLVGLDHSAKLGTDDGANGVRLTIGQNSGGSPWSSFDSYVDNVVINTNTYNFEPMVVQPCTTTATVEITDLSTWDLSQTRATGHNELTTTGLRAWTEGATSTDKAAGYYTTNFALEDAGVPNISFDTYSGGRPSLQLGIDKDNDGTRDAYLVYEPWAYGTGNYWATTYLGVPAGMGYASFGTLNDYLAANPNAHIVQVGYSLGSGVKGGATIAKLTAGCTDYTFKLVPTAAPANLKFTYKNADETDHNLACGEGINSNKPKIWHTNGSLNLNWTAPSGSVSGYQVLVTYPDGSTHLSYQGSNPWAWIQFNDGEGLYTYQVRSSNAAGVSDYSTTCGLYYDTHSPVASFTEAPADGAEVNGVFHVAGTASDNVALKAVNIDVRDSSGWKAGCVTGTLVANYSVDHKSATVSCDVNTANLTEGAPYYVRIHASDYAGYGSADTVPASKRNFIVDRTAPVAPSNLSWKTASNKTVIDNGYTNEYSGSAQWDGLADADHYIYKYWNDISGNPYKVGSEYTTTTSATSLAGVFNQGEGVHHFCVIAVDAAGNQSTCTGFTLTYDKTRPTVAITNPTSFSTPFAAGPNVTATANDSLSSLKTFVIHVYKASDDSAAKFCTATATELANGSMSCDLSTLADGSYYIKAGATDRAGNNQTVTSANFVIDSVAPTITVKSGYVGDLVTKVFSNVSFKLYDAHKVDKYVINSHAVDFTNNTYSDANFQNIKNYLVEGSNTLTLYDVAGNSTTYTFTYDKTAPTATIDGAAPVAYYNGSTNINVHAIDANYKQTDLYHGTDTTPFKTYTGTYFGLFWLGDGDYRMVVRDEAGLSTEYQFTIDRTAPVAHITAPSDSDTVHGTVTVSGTVTDNNPDHYYLVIKNASNHAVAGPGTVNQATVADYDWDTTKVADGAYTIRLEARDAAGNKTSSSIDVVHVTVDNTAPVLTIDSQTKNSDGSYTITGTTSDAASDVVVVLNGTPLSGVTLSGNTWSVNTGLLIASTTYTVTANSTDAVGNAAVEQTANFTTEAPAEGGRGGGGTQTTSSSPQSLVATNQGQTLGATDTQGSTSGNGSDSAVLGAEGQSGTSSSSDNKSNEKTIKNAKETTCTKFLGICWYYWIPVVLIVGYIVYRFFKAADVNETTSGR